MGNGLGELGFWLAVGMVGYPSYRHRHGLLPDEVVPNAMQPPTRYLVPDDRDFVAVYRRLPGPITVPFR